MPGDTRREQRCRESCRAGERHRATLAASKIASMIFTYPVQRQILLRMANAASSRVGFGFVSSSPLAEITMPGMQKPHCTAPALPNA